MERNRNLEMAVLSRISHAVMRERNVSALLRQVLDILCREMGLVRGTVTLLRGRQLVIEASNGLSREEMRRGRYRLGEGVTGQVALTGEARIIPDISQEPEFLYRTGARERDSHVAFICVPVVHQGKVIGTMSIDREVVEGVCRLHRVECAIHYDILYPVNVNPAGPADFARSVIRETFGPSRLYEMPEPSMGGEDFAYYLQRYPGVYVKIGLGEGHPPLHNSGFDFPDEALAIGVEYFVNFVRKASTVL